MKGMIVFLVGPTAVGKSEIAGRLAKKINAEIVSCDSMQVYKGMDILTSQPPAPLKRMVSHHLIGLLSPEREYNVSAYRCQAIEKIKQVLKKKKILLFVGGSGLYMSVLIDGIFEGKVASSIRRALYQELEHYGPAYLYNRLQAVDPQAAGKIHPHDTKRVIRALEVFSATGKTISSLQKERKGLIDEGYTVKIFCLNMEREALYQRINARVERMFRRGLVREVKKLSRRKLSKTAALAIGIRELGGYFDGQYDLAEAKQQIQRNSRLYAKRQLTWFRKDKRINWINIGKLEKAQDIACRIKKELS
ncbi:MAG: tRNA (adenosine(37)-N6)-dimethylallyltransferase MiaA [Candidatus Omnitrophota bacterium]|nr:tRNA (adenosine(37)-N6)-dimethylallyltransferase MiaA [Candidatus Omnitrophota bacterium]